MWARYPCISPVRNNFITRSKKKASVTEEKQSSLTNLSSKNIVSSARNTVFVVSKLIVYCHIFSSSKHIALPCATAHFPLFSPQRALPTEAKVKSGTSQIKSGTSVNLSNSGNFPARCHARRGKLVLKPSLDALSLRSNVISPTKILSPHVEDVSLNIGTIQCQYLALPVLCVRCLLNSGKSIA